MKIEDGLGKSLIVNLRDKDKVGSNGRKFITIQIDDEYYDKLEIDLCKEDVKELINELVNLL